MKRITCAVLISLMLALANPGAAAAGTIEFRVATIPFTYSYCFTDTTDTLRFEFDISEGLLTHAMYQTFTAADQGQLRWWTPATTNFDVHTALLTNGLPNLTNRLVLNFYTGQGAGTGYQTEAQFLGPEVGPNGIDLAGFHLSRIGLKFTRVQLWAGQNGTCYSVQITMLLLQTATKAACLKDGWRYLERLDGTPFDSLFACGWYAYTGK